jgi:hypothetical protein
MYSTNLISAKRDKSITMPTNAFLTLFLASSIADLSPPEVIHWTDPIINKARNKTAPITKPAVSRTPITD